MCEKLCFFVAIIFFSQKKEIHFCKFVSQNVVVVFSFDVISLTLLVIYFLSFFTCKWMCVCMCARVCVCKALGGRGRASVAFFLLLVFWQQKKQEKNYFPLIVLGSLTEHVVFPPFRRLGDDRVRVDRRQQQQLVYVRRVVVPAGQIGGDSWWGGNEKWVPKTKKEILNS